LAAEREQAGPVPIDLINGSVYRGGRVPPLDPTRTLRLLRPLAHGEALDPAALEDLISLPTGGIVTGDLVALLEGRAARVQMSCHIERERRAGQRLLVIRGTPAGVDLEQVVMLLTSRVDQARRPSRRHDADFYPQGFDKAGEPAMVSDVRDESSCRTGTRIVVDLAPDADVDEAERWVRGVWPVTVEADWLIPGGLAARLRSWAGRCHVAPSGLDALGDLLR
jgi:hypothetical protein